MRDRVSMGTRRAVGGQMEAAMCPGRRILLALLAAAAAAANQVPEELLIRLEAAHNLSQFLSTWVEPAALQRAYYGEEELGVAPPAGCVPELRAVPLPTAPGLLLWPACTRVRRCGGCCASKRLRCVPTRTSTLTLKVLKARYPGSGLLRLEGTEEVRLEQHERCACQCAVREADCPPRAVYRPGQCACVCAPCPAPTHPARGRCACTCPHAPCSTGRALNTTTCRCEPEG